MTSFRINDRVRSLFESNAPVAGDDGKVLAYNSANNSLDFTDIGTQVELDAVVKNGFVTTTKHSAPSDASLAAGDLSIWFDQTDGAGKLKIKGKTANGTVVAGEVALT